MNVAIKANRKKSDPKKNNLICFLTNFDEYQNNNPFRNIYSSRHNINHSSVKVKDKDKVNTLCYLYHQYIINLISLFESLNFNLISL
jgi:hypothetical protein